MNITSKFDIGSKVWIIDNRHEVVWVPCPACEGTGTVQLKNGPRSCPDCYGRLGSNKFLPTKWMLCVRDHHSLPFTVGQVRFEIESTTSEEKYMCHETGVGSGTLFGAELMFASKEEAQAACDEKNEAIARLEAK